MKRILTLACAFALVLAFGACKKKEVTPATPEKAVTEVTPPPAEEPVVEVPESAGAKPVAAPSEVAKVQLLDGLKYTLAVVGWDNPFAATMVGRTLDVIAALTPTAEGEAKDALAKAQTDLMGVKTKLDEVVAKKGSLTKEELKALQETLRNTYDALAAVYRPSKVYSEAEGRKLKEGHRLKEEKLKEGGDAQKRKWAERGGK